MQFFKFQGMTSDMENMCVQFSDSSGSTIITYFGSEQSDSVYQNLGTVATSDARWKAFYDSVSPMVQGLPLPTSEAPE